MCFLIFPFLSHPKSGNCLSRALEASKMSSEDANGHISSVYYPRNVLWRFQDLKNFFKFSCLIYHGWHLMPLTYMIGRRRRLWKFWKFFLPTFHFFSFLSLQISSLIANNLYSLYRGKEKRAATNIMIIFFLFSKFWKKL